MFFNVDKCKILHIGKDNPNFDYQMEDKDGNSTNLIVVNCEKDLGVYVQDNLKFDKHFSLTVNRANRLVGLIKLAFSYLDDETTSSLQISDSANIGLWQSHLVSNIKKGY